MIEEDQEKHPKSSLQFFPLLLLLRLFYLCQSYLLQIISLFPLHIILQMLVSNMNWCHIFLVYGVWKIFDLDFFFSSFYRRHKWQLMTFNISGIWAIKVYFLVHQTVASIVRAHLKSMCLCVWSDTLFLVKNKLILVCFLVVCACPVQHPRHSANRTDTLV